MKYLDCTLRDGGYINNWNFGEKAIREMIDRIALTGVDYLELGFLRNVEYDINRTLFSRVSQAAALIPESLLGKVKFAVMADFADLIDPDKIEPYQPGYPEMIRVLIWKQKRDKDGVLHDALQDGFDYCKKLIEKGYKVSIQPTRTNQYAEYEYINMLKLFSQIDISAVYVADSWGNMTPDDVVAYMKAADRLTAPGVLIGYHGHDNQLRTEEIAGKIMSENFSHEVMIDASIDGIGKGGGNMKLQSLARLAGIHFGKHMDVDIMNDLAEKYIWDIYRQHAWGGPAFAVAGRYNCNPYYADFYLNELHLSVEDIEAIISSLSNEDKIMYKKDKAIARMEETLKRREEEDGVPEGKKVVLTYGTFDLLHQGHINILRRAKEAGDYLIVGVTTPEFDVQRGKLDVYQSYEERVKGVQETGFADKIIPESSRWQKVADIAKYKADIFAIGSDWEGKFDYLKEYCQVIYFPRTEGVSSTMLRENIREQRP